MPVTPQTSPPLNRVRELPAGDKVTGFYLLARLEVRQKRDGAPYLVLLLQDATGTLEAKMWENFEHIRATAQVGNVLKVEGTVDRYRDAPSLTISRARVATEEEVPDKRAFLPHASLSAENARAQLHAVIASVKDAALKALLQAVFGDEDFLRAFLDAPGGKSWHHATLGGLAEHTLSLARTADAVAHLYPALNRDLLLTGALLHDIGKVEELRAETTIDYSVEGRLIGHIVQGAMRIERVIAALPDFPAETRRHVLHLILSHQGHPEMSSPVKPMTREALVLHYLDELDSKLDAFARVQAHTPAGQEFSEYVRLMDRFFYMRPADTGEGVSP